MKELVQLKEKLFNYRVLFVDDEVEVRDGTAMILKKFFNIVELASNGKEGLEKFQQDRYDIIITDVKMPIMNGYEMINEIKKVDPNVYITYISADREIVDQIEQNSNVYYTKPITYDDILDILKNIVSHFER